MVVSEIDQEVTDYDWFAIDREGRVGHFATGGFGSLPKSVATSGDDLKSVSDFFRNRLRCSTEASLAPKAQEAAKIMDNEAAVARRFQDFVNMARRGLYSFDHSYALDVPTAGTRPCPIYHRIAIPTEPIHLTDLVVGIQNILGKTVLPDADFSQHDEVSVE